VRHGRVVRDIKSEVGITLIKNMNQFEFARWYLKKNWRIQMKHG